MPKRKSKFTEELQQEYPFFRKGRDEFEAECITCGYETFVSVANKGKLSLDIHVDQGYSTGGPRSESGPLRCYSRTSSFRMSDSKGNVLQFIKNGALKFSSRPFLAELMTCSKIVGISVAKQVMTFFFFGNR